MTTQNTELPLMGLKGQTLARRNRWRRRLMAQQAGQSLIVAIIVLFLLLFIGGIFIALIANNLRSTRRGLQVSQAGRYAEAGIRYLDQQLTTSPEGADWRPVPMPVAELRSNDPDYYYLQPLRYDPDRREWVGGYSRIEFGGPNAGSGPTGGRALVRITYRPYRIDPNSGSFWDDLNGNRVLDAGEVVNAGVADRTRKYIKLESVGRVGVIEANDPTTFRNTEAFGLRRELVAYKAIGITDYLRFVTNKERKPDPAPLGAALLVHDRPTVTDPTDPQDIKGDPNNTQGYGGVNIDGDGDLEVVNRTIPSIYQGPIRVNGNLAFYGLNYITLDPRRGDALEVAGQISLNGVAGTATRAQLAGNDRTKVHIAPLVVDPSVPAGSQPIPPDAATSLTRFAGVDGANPPFAGNVVPSTSSVFDTYQGLVRDNPRGNDTQALETSTADVSNANLRAIPRLEPPVIDEVIGNRGLTRYRALTRDAAPMNPQHTNNTVGIPAQYAGQYGWGENLYIANSQEIFTASSQSNFTTQRAQWLNPDVRTDPGNQSGVWRHGQFYEPPAVTITLTPRYMIMERALSNGPSYLRRPDNGQPVASDVRVIRYSYSTEAQTAGATSNLSATPQIGFPAGLERFAGYPVSKAGPDGVVGTADDTPYFEGDFVIYAEGNVRIRGVAGGVDPETRNTFVRHLTVVSNGTIYVDGNLLRDNIPTEISSQPFNLPAVARQARGKSSIALLAKNYVAVNTTQFLKPVTVPGSEQGETGGSEAVPPLTVTLNPGSVTGPANSQFNFQSEMGPLNAYDPVTGLPVLQAGNLASYAPLFSTFPDYRQSIYFRHGKPGNGSVAINLLINSSAATTRNRYSFAPNIDHYEMTEDAPDNSEQGANTPLFRDDRFDLSAATSFLFPQNAYPYGANTPALGTPNLLTVNYDTGRASQGLSYKMTRVGIAPLDVRIEALMYAQEGSFFIIPGPWFNPDPNDTYERYVSPGQESSTIRLRRNGESGMDADAATPERRVDPQFPFYQQPQDIRITFYGAIAENRPAEVGDQAAWMEKWGWIPRYYGSTGLPAASGYPDQGAAGVATIHGPNTATGNRAYMGTTGNGIQFVYDARGVAPYDAAQAPLRPNPYQPNDPLPLTPRLPVAPGLLYFGEGTIQ